MKIPIFSFGYRSEKVTKYDLRKPADILRCPFGFLLFISVIPYGFIFLLASQEWQNFQYFLRSGQWMHPVQSFGMYFNLACFTAASYAAISIATQALIGMKRRQRIRNLMKSGMPLDQIRFEDL